MPDPRSMTTLSTTTILDARPMLLHDTTINNNYTWCQNHTAWYHCVNNNVLSSILFSQFCITLINTIVLLLFSQWHHYKLQPTLCVSLIVSHHYQQQCIFDLRIAT